MNPLCESQRSNKTARTKAATSGHDSAHDNVDIFLPPSSFPSTFPSNSLSPRPSINPPIDSKKIKKEKRKEKREEENAPPPPPLPPSPPHPLPSPKIPTPFPFPSPPARVHPPTPDIVRLTFSTKYDHPLRPLSKHACWDPTTRTIPPFAHWQKQREIGVGILALRNLSRDACGTCWTLTYGGATRPFLVTDRVRDGADGDGDGDGDGAEAVTSVTAMDGLTGGMAVKLGTVTVSARRLEGLMSCGWAGRGDEEEEEEDKGLLDRADL